ncbi:MAG: Flp pilus assembly protein CpaB [Planctomycetes bacterium]|nr:Flp pilus assembly protein CpaB [Planctomycetota bacterium]
MKFKSVLLLAIALGCGAVAMVGVRQLTKKDPGPQEETVPVLVSTTEILSGTPLDETNVAFKKWPKAMVPEGAVTTPEQYEERSLKGGAVAGEVILLAKLSEAGVFGASADIPKDMRVVTVPVDLTKTHSGLIQPGDRVDLMVTYKSRGGSGMETRTRTFLEYIEVFATDNRRSTGGGTVDLEDNKVKNISLLVTPEQGNLVMLASSKGTIHLALRHKTDDAVTKTPVMTDDFFEEGQALAGNKETSVENWTNPEGGGDVHAELAAEMARQTGEPTATMTAETPVEPPKNIWQVEIYAGQEVRVQELELPVEETETEPAQTI